LVYRTNNADDLNVNIIEGNETDTDSEQNNTLFNKVGSSPAEADLTLVASACKQRENWSMHSSPPGTTGIVIAMKRLSSPIGMLSGILVTTGCTAIPLLSSIIPPPSLSNSEEPAGDLVDEYCVIAHYSCELAREIGVTERADGTSLRSVLVPETYAYNDFFAAVVCDSGGQEPIWTTEEFMACVDSINFILAEEAG
jgi:hypothetical protein